jgi:TrwC relaxase
VATAFTHRDSRAGDPDLHTHVAVANKVQTLDGRWLSIDGRVLFKANVAASETYDPTWATARRPRGRTGS